MSLGGGVFGSGCLAATSPAKEYAGRRMLNLPSFRRLSPFFLPFDHTNTDLHTIPW